MLEDEIASNKTWKRSIITKTINLANESIKSEYLSLNSKQRRRYPLALKKYKETKEWKS